jgi:hypothetical protein
MENVMAKQAIRFRNLENETNVRIIERGGGTGVA